MIHLAPVKVLLGVVLTVLGAGGVAAAVNGEIPAESDPWNPSSALYGVSEQPTANDAFAADDDGTEEAGEEEIEAEIEVEIDATDGLSDDELAVLCAEAGSHGEYVSQVARDRITETDGNHGERVREAAQSDCGKSEVDEEPPPAEEQIEVEIDATDGLSDDELAVLCAEAGSHGEYVSQVARDRITETDGNHGERVREAAQSDCGKSEVDEEPPPAEDEIEAAESDADHPGNGKGNGNGNGNGGNNGNGRGRGHDKKSD